MDLGGASEEERKHENKKVSRYFNAVVKGYYDKNLQKSRKSARNSRTLAGNRDDSGWSGILPIIFTQINTRDTRVDPVGYNYNFASAASTLRTNLAVST